MYIIIANNTDEARLKTKVLLKNSQYNVSLTITLCFNIIDIKSRDILCRFAGILRLINGGSLTDSEV